MVINPSIRVVEFETIFTFFFTVFFTFDFFYSIFKALNLLSGWKKYTFKKCRWALFKKILKSKASNNFSKIVQRFCFVILNHFLLAFNIQDKEQLTKIRYIRSSRKKIIRQKNFNMKRQTHFEAMGSFKT